MEWEIKQRKGADRPRKEGRQRVGGEYRSLSRGVCTSEPISPLIGLVNAIVADPRNFSLLDSLLALVLLLCAARDNVRAICVIHSGLFLCLAGVSDIILPLPFYSFSSFFLSLSRVTPGLGDCLVFSLQHLHQCFGLVCFALSYLFFFFSRPTKQHTSFVLLFSFLFAFFFLTNLGNDWYLLWHIAVFFDPILLFTDTRGFSSIC